MSRKKKIEKEYLEECPACERFKNGNISERELKRFHRAKKHGFPAEEELLEDEEELEE